MRANARRRAEANRSFQMPVLNARHFLGFDPVQFNQLGKYKEIFDSIQNSPLMKMAEQLKNATETSEFMRAVENTRKIQEEMTSVFRLHADQISRATAISEDIRLRLLMNYSKTGT